MKFKATVRDSRTFARVCQACRAIERRWVIKIHPLKMRFFTSGQVADGMQVWASCCTKSILGDYQSQSPHQDDAIFCEVPDMSQLHHLMRQAERYSSVTVKLAWTPAKRPALRILMKNVSPQLVSSYDVPVRVLGKEEILRISAPLLEGEVMQVVLPKFSDLTLFVEKIRSTSCDRVTFSAQRNEAENGGPHASCRFVIAAECFHGSFALKYDAAQLGDCDDTEGTEDTEGSGGESPGDEQPPAATVAVELKKFARLLAIREITPQRVAVHLVDGKAFVLSISTPGGISLVGYIPAVLLG